MLVEFAFMASTAAGMHSVAEAFVAHELATAEKSAASSSNATTGTSVTPGSSVALSNTTFTSKDLSAFDLGMASRESVRVDEATVKSRTGMSLLRGISGLTPRQILNYVQKNAVQFDSLRELRLAPAEVSAWWTSLGTASRTTLTYGAPAMVGSLEGLPADVRGVANERTLQQAMDENQERAASGIGKGERRKLGQQERMLEAVNAALESKPGEPERTLLDFDARDAGRAVIVIGDLDTADYVSYLVPGMYFSVQQQIRDWTDTAAVLAVEQQQWLQDVPQGTADAPRVATIAWLGYQTPDLLNIGGLELAHEGADALEQSWKGIRASRGDSQPYLTVLAHSYGSTAAMIALERHSEPIDALALIGSPGSASQNASDLGVRGNRVFVGEASWDPIVNTAFYGSDPGAASFGAVRMGVGGGTDPLTQKPLEASFGHNAYFAAGSESLRNLALIGIGRGAWVSDAAHPTPNIVEGPRSVEARSDSVAR